MLQSTKAGDLPLITSPTVEESLRPCLQVDRTLRSVGPSLAPGVMALLTELRKVMSPSFVATAIKTQQLVIRYKEVNEVFCAMFILARNH